MKSVMLFGTFDILHPGHLYVFTEAKKYGDYVMAVVARDERVEEIKGRRPLFNEQDRSKLLSHLDLVDDVLLGDKTDVYRHIKERKPDVIVLGYDQHHFTEELKAVLADLELPTRIVRLEPFREDVYKSGRIRSQLEL